MAQVEFPYLHIRKNRHGKEYPQFRKRGMKSIPLPRPIGGKAFRDKYEECMALVEGTSAGRQKVGPKSFAALVQAFYGSITFASLDRNSTQKTYRRVLDGFCKEHGAKPVALLVKRNVENMIAARASTPAAANQLLKRLKQVLDYGVENDWLKQNPAKLVKRVKYKPTPHHTWTEEEAEQFLSFHPPGTMAHTAMMLMLYTGVRRSDLVKLGRGNVRTILMEDGPKPFIVIDRQEKTEDPVEIPVHDRLAPIIEAIKGRLIFVLTAYGRPFTVKGFGNRMRDWCDEAGLPDCTAHGLRKLILVRVVQAGGNENTLSAIAGWSNNDQAALYTRAANKRRLALAGMKSIK